VIVMTRAHRVRLGILTLIAAALFVCISPAPRRLSALPDRLDDRTFWAMVQDYSEQNGYFRSDNLVSNEIVFQHVIPTLQAELDPMSAYVGVGPDQNFTYIAALKPRIAFIVDIRRQNMLLHLMYKAIIELSPTRAEFLSRLFSRPIPPGGNSPRASADVLLGAFAREEEDTVAYERNMSDIRRQLMREHGFALSPADLGAIDYVYRAFLSAGPDIRYSFGRGPGWQPFPSYRDLMIADDGAGVERSYLATEANYDVLRDLEERNLIVPLVGDFGGPKALRSIGRYLDIHHAAVSAFYTSNVEQYLFNGEQWQRFYDNVAALPIDSHSTFIRAVFNNGGRVYFYGGAQPIPLGRPGGPRPYQPPGPRSDTLLNPISTLLAAYAEGRISSYYDVVELSRQ
jgi:hypothetical protein